MPAYSIFVYNLIFIKGTAMDISSDVCRRFDVQCVVKIIFYVYPF